MPLLSPLLPMTELCCYIEGKRVVLFFSVDPNSIIDDLKKQIYNEAPRTFAGCDPMDLNLTKM